MKKFKYKGYDAQSVEHALIRQGKYLQLSNVMMSGRAQGMQTMDAALKLLGIRNEKI